MAPLTHPAQKNLPGGQRDQGCGIVLHVQYEVYQSTLTSQFCPKSAGRC